MGKCSLDDIARAIPDGHLEVLEWVYQKLRKTPSKTLQHYFQHDERLQAALENCSSLGYIEILEWVFHHHRCPDDTWVAICEIALENGYPSIVEWLAPKGVIKDFSSLFVEACGAGYLSLAKTLHKSHRFQTEDLQNAADEACVKGHLDVIEWLHGYNIHPDSSAASDAEFYQFRDMTDFLYSVQEA